MLSDESGGDLSEKQEDAHIMSQEKEQSSAKSTDLSSIGHEKSLKRKGGGQAIKKLVDLHIQKQTLDPNSLEMAEVMSGIEKMMKKFDKFIANKLPSPFPHFMRGELLDILGHNDDAMHEYTTAVSMGSYKVFGFLMSKGKIWASNNLHEDAIREYDKALTINPKNTDTCDKKAKSLFALGRDEEALLALKNIIMFDPQNSESYYKIAEALEDLGRDEEAKSERAKAQAIETNHTDIATQLSANDEEIKECEQHIAINPDNPWDYFAKGSLLSAKGCYADALVAFEKAVELKPKCANFYMHKGAALSSLGRHAEALTEFETALSFAPKLADLYIYKGRALLALHIYEEALTEFSNAIDINPKNADAYYEKIKVLLPLGRFEEATLAHDRVIELNPKSTVAHYKKLHMFLDLGLKEAALEEYNPIIAECEKAPEDTQEITQNTEYYPLGESGRDSMSLFES